MACLGRIYSLTLGESGEVEKIRALIRTQVVVSGAENQAWARQQLSSHELEPRSEAWRGVLSSISRGFEPDSDSQRTSA